MAVVCRRSAETLMTFRPVAHVVYGGLSKTLVPCKKVSWINLSATAEKTQCWFNAEPASKTLEWTCRVCCDACISI